MKEKLIFLALLMIVGLFPAFRKHVSAAGDQANCTNTPCGDTPTGEDPSEVAEREGGKILEAMRGSASDRQRWGITLLYSSEKDPASLELDVIKAMGFRVRLQPQTGRLTFEKNGVAQAFAFAAPPGTPNNLCPRYAIAVVDASSTHAVIKKSCLQFEYKPKRFHKEIEYFLYDMPTGSMRSIWNAATEDTTLVGPMVTPNPVFRSTKNGYQLDWTVTDISKSATEKYKVRTSYVREKQKGGKSVSLVCTDLTGAKGENVEQGVCEGKHLELVAP